MEAAFAQSIGLPNVVGPVCISLINAAAVVGLIIIGWLMDRIDPTTAILVASVGSSAAVFLVWGLALSTAPLYVFSVLYGATAGGYAASWSGCVRILRQRCADENGVSRVEGPMVMAFFAAGKGIGAVASGPLSSKLFEADHWYHKLGGAFGTGYGTLIVWTGASAFLGGAPWVGKRLGLI